MSIQDIDKKIPILIVDDFATMRRLVKTSLLQMGFQNISEAEDGKAALDKLQNGNFKLVISDWNMPNMMGVDLLHAVRADEKLKPTPFLMVAAEAQEENIAQATKAEDSAYVVKPFTPDSLQEKLETILKTK